MTEPFDGVVIIGGGIVGLCTALSLVEDGVRVRIIERDPGGEPASSGNAGVISPFSVVPQSLPGLWRRIPRWLLDPLGPVALRPSHLPRFLPWALKFLANGRREKVLRISEAMHQLNHQNVDLYRRHLAGTGREDLIRESCYVLAARDPEALRLDAFEHDLRRAKGARIERVGDARLREIEPALSPDFKGAIVIHGQARAVSPGAICAVFRQRLLEAGTDFVDAEVRRLCPVPDGGWAVETVGGVIEARRVVIAAGAWSAKLLEPLGVKVPLEAERGYHVRFADTGATLENSVMDVDMKIVVSSMSDGLRAAGTAEFAGLDARPDMRRAEKIAAMTRRMIPGLNGAVETHWSGIRPSFPDSLPAIGKIGAFDGLFAGFGHSHYGFMMAPQTGRLLAATVQDKAMNVDMEPYRPTRFS